MEVRQESKKVYDGKILSLRIDKVINKSNRASIREVVEHRGSVAILPILDDSFILERQYRYAIDKVLLEVPAGTLEEGEEPLECAKRELLEETGYYSDELEHMGMLYLTPGYCTEKMHFFIARNLVKKSNDLDEDEIINVEIISIRDAINMAIRGEIVDMKSAYMILRYAMMNRLL